MKVSLFCLLIALLSFGATAQTSFNKWEISGTRGYKTDAKSGSLSQLNRVTVGFGIGPAALFDSPQDPFLTPGDNELQLQFLSRYNLVIATVLTLKFGKTASEDNTLYRIDAIEKTAEQASFWDRLTLNVGVNLLETDLESVAFNKAVDGGFGLGYMFGEDIHLAWFLDFNSYRQLRGYIVDNYQDQRIPEGDEFLNALDPQDQNLFYSKRILGTSLKLLVTLGSKKDSAPETYAIQ